MVVGLSINNNKCVSISSSNALLLLQEKVVIHLSALKGDGCIFFCNKISSSLHISSLHISSLRLRLPLPLPLPLPFPRSFKHNNFSSSSSSSSSCSGNIAKFRPPPAQLHQLQEEEEEEEEEEEGRILVQLQSEDETKSSSSNYGGNSAIISACFVGLLTGCSVVLFNYGVHEIRDFFWDEFPNRGASWLRDKPVELIWQRVILVPVFGGLIVSLLKTLLDALNYNKTSFEEEEEEEEEQQQQLFFGLSIYTINKAALQPFIKAIAACVTLGTGNSLGPEGPSVEIGSSIAKAYGTLFDKTAKRNLSLVAAGSAAGIASGFNAAVAGCFFAIESVLWPSTTNSSLSQSNTTSMVILSAVIASVVSEIGLGSQPAFKVPEYDFRSPSELPLYLLLGLLCGLVSLTLTRSTSYLLVSVEKFHKANNIPKATFPIMGSLATGMIAVAYPEILYWGFENVDILLESRPFVKGLSADLLVQLVAAKIVATSICRASGLVGGYYAPSLFIGAATGMAYGKLISFGISQTNPILHLSVLEVASPQAYGLVGMAATLAGVCQVPLTSVLLLFELTQDYRIVLPLLGAVGLSSWITSGKMKEGGAEDNKNIKDQNNNRSTEKSEISSKNPTGVYPKRPKASFESDLCQLESSLCVGDSNIETSEVEKRIFVSESMRTSYVTVLMGTSLTKALSLMLAEKQSCAMVVDNENFLLGLVTVGSIQEFSKSAKARSRRPGELLVYDLCSSNGKNCRVSWTATPNMDLCSAQMIMKRHGVSQLPVLSEQIGNLVGLLDRECIDLACRVVETRERLS